MKLEQIQEYVVPTIALAVGLGIALACGLMIGQGDSKWALMIVGGLLVMGFLLAVQKRIWILILVTSMFGGKITALPVPFTVANLGVLIAFGMYLILKALKVVRLKPKIGIVEISMMVMLAYLATVYVRNPVGVEAFDSDRVGGRPYVDIIIACVGFWVLSRSAASVRESYIIPCLQVAGNACLAFVNYVAFRFPSTIGPLSGLYSGIAAAENPDAAALGLEEGSRFAYLGGVAGNIIGVACAFWRPFTLLNPMHIWRFAFFFVGMTATLLSGFRSGLFAVFEVFILGSYFRRGMPEVLRAAVLGGGVLSLLILVQGNIINLPFAAQRTLSFLPGKWDYAAKSEAQGSTEWRVEMWKAMLTGNKYIENKWLGDGFGFTHRQLEIMSANATTGTTADQQENVMISGGVHSGPISTIRYVGYVGLALFMVLLILMARKAFQLIRRARGTPLFPFVLLNSIPPIVFPFNFVFIFGGFDGDLANAIFMIGVQKMLENSLDAHLGEQKSDRAIIQPPKFRPVPEFAPAGRR